MFTDQHFDFTFFSRNKPLIFILNGWLAPSQIWYPVIKRIPVWDFIIFSPAGIEEASPLKNLARRISDFNPLMLWGWSLGGLLSLKLMQQVPRLKQAILFGSFCRFLNGENYQSGVSAESYEKLKKLVQTESAAGIRAFLSSLFTATQRKNGHFSRFLKNYQNLFENKTITEIESGLRLLEQTDFHESLQAISVPVTLIHGKQDLVVPYAASVYLSQKIPDSTLILWEEEGHLPFYTNPEKLEDLIKQESITVAHCL